MESETDKTPESKPEDNEAETVRVEELTVHAFLDGTYNNGDYISPEAMAEAFKKHPNPNVVLNSDQKDVLGRVTRVSDVSQTYPMITMRLYSKTAIRWFAEADRRKEKIVFGIDCRVLERKGNVITKLDYISVSLIPAEPYKPANPDAMSLGKFTLTEVSLVDKDMLEINGMTHKYITKIALRAGVRRGTIERELIEMARTVSDIWILWDAAIETAQMQDRANKQIHSRLMALEQLARWAAKLGPCENNPKVDGDCMGPECALCQTRYRAKELV